MLESCKDSENLKIYKDLLRSHTNQKKTLDSLKDEIVELGNIFAGKSLF